MRWIKWDGGKQPVVKETQVILHFRDGSTTYRIKPAVACRWEHLGGGDDIVAYFVVPKYNPEKEKADESKTQ